MGTTAIRDEELQPRSRVLFELAGELLADVLVPRKGNARLELEYQDGKLKWIQPSPRIPAEQLGEYEQPGAD